jgi:hypothetical protein
MPNHRSDGLALQRGIDVVEIQRRDVRFSTVDTGMRQQVVMEPSLSVSSLPSGLRDGPPEVLVAIDLVVLPSIRGMAFPAVAVDLACGRVLEGKLRQRLQLIAPSASHQKLRVGGRPAHGRRSNWGWRSIRLCFEFGPAKLRCSTFSMAIRAPDIAFLDFSKD